MQMGGSVFLFPATREALRRRWTLPLAVLIASLFGLASMVMGGMLVIARTGQPGTTVYLLTGGSAPWWNYPGLLITFPNATIALPFFATITMIIVSIGVGLGLTVATVLWVRLLHQRRAQAAGSAALGSLAGLTPAFLALATIGACCSITASTAAGLGVVSQASGANAYDLLANNWYLGVFQMVVLGIALLAHEAILQTYGPLLGITTPWSRAGGATPVSGNAESVRRSIARALLRVALLIGGILWALAGLALFVTDPAPFASAGFWFAFLVQHEFVAGVAIFLSVVPGLGRAVFEWSSRRRGGWALRLPLLLAGVSLLGWIPPAGLGSGAAGLFNEVFGMAGLPTSWGAVVPAVVGPIALGLRWGLGYVLLGAWGLVLGAFPARAMGWFYPLSTTAPTPRTGSSAPAPSELARDRPIGE